jgi:hypothetical protein
MSHIASHGCKPLPEFDVPIFGLSQVAEYSPCFLSLVASFDWLPRPDLNARLPLMSTPELFLPSQVIGFMGLIGTIKYRIDAWRLRLAARSLASLRASPAPSPPVSSNGDKGSPIFHFLDLSAQETAEVLRKSKALDVSTGNLICAALTLAIRHTAPENDAADVLLHRTINIRGNMNPTVRSLSFQFFPPRVRLTRAHDIGSPYLDATYGQVSSENLGQLDSVSKVLVPKGLVLSKEALTEAMLGDVARWIQQSHQEYEQRGDHIRAYIRIPWQPKPAFEFTNYGDLSHVVRIGGDKTSLVDVRIANPPHDAEVPSVSARTFGGCLCIEASHAQENFSEASIRMWLQHAVNILVNKLP